MKLRWEIVKVTVKVTEKNRLVAFYMVALCFVALLGTGCATHKPGYNTPYGYTAAAQHKVEPVTITRAPPAQRKLQSTLQHEYAKWAGTPYQLGGTGRRGIDCSALMKQVFSTAFNKSLPRTTAQQVKVGASISKNKLQVGDLIFFKTGYNQRHVGVFMGDDAFFHASVSKGVTFSRLNDEYWRSRYWQSRRVL